MEETYTKEQLISAMTIYNQNVIDNPDSFEVSGNAETRAKEQIEYLLSLVDE